MEARDLPILVVDDVQAMRAQIRSLLAGAGYKNVITVGNGVEGKEALDKAPFSLVIADWHMTPINGMEFLKYVRQHAVHSQIAFVMITAEDAKEQVIEAISQGVDDYLIKPLTIEKITSRIENVLRRKKVLT